MKLRVRVGRESTASWRGVKTICKTWATVQAVEPTQRERRRGLLILETVHVWWYQIHWDFLLGPKCGVEAAEWGNSQAGLLHGMWNASQQR